MPPDDAAAARARLRAAQEAAYGPHPDPAGPVRLRALQEEQRLAPPPLRSRQDDDASSREPAPDRPVVRVRGGRGMRAAVTGTAVALAAALSFALGWTTRPAPPPSLVPPSVQQQLQQRVLASRGALAAQDYYGLYPDDLPIDWGGASTGTSARHLVGSQTVRLSPSEASSRLLIVPTCAERDRRSDWTLLAADGRALAAGRDDCGGFGAGLVQFSAADRAAGLRLRISVAGDVPYAVTVFEQ